MLEKFFEKEENLTETARGDFRANKDEFTVLKEGKLLDFQEKAILNTARFLCEYGQINFCEEPEEGAEKWKMFLREKYEKENIKKQEKGKINYFENEVNFWMATGSGKTFVIAKLIDNLLLLMNSGVIPYKNIMVLAPNETILSQIKETTKKICTKDFIFENLKEYRDDELFDVVYFYNSTNITTEEQIAKKRDGERINFEDYGENWYVILDEAHKGSGEEAKRREYYRSFASNGLLFNFSATLTEVYDRNAVIFNYNLAGLLKEGYGKRVAIMNGDFKDLLISGEYRTVLKSIILFTAIKRAKPLKGYHNPLCLAVADTVNTKNSNLKMFFEATFRFEEFKQNFEDVRIELKNEISNLKCFITESEIKGIELDFDFDEVLKYFYNTNGGADEIVYSYDKSTGEVAFKCKNGFDYFALLKISAGEDFVEYLKLDIKEEKVLIKDFFKSLNEPSNNLSVLLGSKCFNEGWDSNRPNVINFINIGSSKARQYVMQTIGRGVRIEPSKGSKKRTGESILENLFVFATHKEGVKSIISELGKEKEGEEIMDLGDLIKPSKAELELYVPTFKKLENDAVKLEVPLQNYEELKSYIAEFSNKHIIAKKKIANIKVLTEMESLVKKKNIQKEYVNPSSFLNRLLSFKKEGFELEDVNPLAEIIKHYTYVKLTYKDKFIAEKVREFTLQSDITETEYEKIKTEISERKAKTAEEKLILKTSYEDFILELKEDKFNKFQNGIDIEINYNLQKHYYNPVIYAQSNISHVINTPSEYEFLQNLQTAKAFLNENFNWCFSRNMPMEIGIPYLEDGTFANFYPDFIFWLETKNSQENFIIFVDPKGILLAEKNTINKIKGFEETLKEKEIKKNGKTFKFALGLYNAKTETESIIEAYRFHDSLEFFKEIKVQLEN